LYKEKKYDEESCLRNEQMVEKNFEFFNV